MTAVQHLKAPYEDGKRMGADNARRMLRLIDRLIANEPDPVVRCEYRRQAVEIRRTLIELITISSPFHRPVTTPPAVTSWPMPPHVDHTVRDVTLQPIERGAP